ncbi:hypothetical protein ASPFODRAFT_83047 [Aspergillus luchuensis CBS 106.47]|uniref:Uncharacterized protein n=1 Tax=Aspergillus luchuensis (strain CBS 106.47) TaxID=1137211 RepID=A0A1M3TDJ4_ASPLC|nr:hypothetical protein ASPFODRAFT_83047 [Aspergillus luchuensis CBS 106.47]
MFSKAFNVLRAPHFLIGALWKWHECRISEMPGITWNAADQYSGRVRSSRSSQYEEFDMEWRRVRLSACLHVEWSRSELYTLHNYDCHKKQYELIQLSTAATSIPLEQCIAGYGQHDGNSPAFSRFRELMRNMASSPKKRIGESRLSLLSGYCQIGKRALALTGPGERAPKPGYKYKSARQLHVV